MFFYFKKLFSFWQIEFKTAIEKEQNKTVVKKVPSTYSLQPLIPDDELDKIKNKKPNDSGYVRLIDCQWKEKTKVILQNQLF